MQLFLLDGNGPADESFSLNGEFHRMHRILQAQHMLVTLRSIYETCITCIIQTVKDL